MSFAYMFIKKDDYLRIEGQFLEEQPSNQHNFFFMLYFQFLYHTFIKNVVKAKPCQIFIDEHKFRIEKFTRMISILLHLFSIGKFSGKLILKTNRY